MSEDVKEQVVSTAIATPSAMDRDAAAFEETAADRATADPARGNGAGINAVYAATICLEIVAAVEPFRPQLEQLIDFDLVHLDRLAARARALRYIQGVIERRRARAPYDPTKIRLAYKLREAMMKYGDALTPKGFFQAGLVERLRPGSGDRDLVEDLNALYQEYKSRPEVTGPFAPVSVEDVNRAAELLEELGASLRPTELPKFDFDALLAARGALIDLVLDDWAQLRRAMDYLRFAQGDAAKLVPSLYVVGARNPSKEQAPPSPADHPFAQVHEALHAHEVPPAYVDPEDNPFAPSED